MRTLILLVVAALATALNNPGGAMTRFQDTPKAGHDGHALVAEYINHPAAFIIDPKGTVRLACFGTYWGDRPCMPEVLEMIRTGQFDYTHPGRLSANERE